MACVCRRYNARSDCLIVTELQGIILPITSLQKQIKK